jgi:hypothetical protein
MAMRPDRIAHAAAVAMAVGQQPLPERGPMVGGEVWEQVVANAGGRCECEACTARIHRKAYGRCWVQSSPARPLHAIPRDPAGEIEAMMLPVGELMAICDACHAAADARAKRARAAAGTDAPTLFDDGGDG